MPKESAISEEFEKYDDEEELRRLIRAVQFSQKHFLYFVCCNQINKQNELIAEIKRKLKGNPIKVIKFKKPITDLLGELQKMTIGKNCKAVFVQGLEKSISSDEAGADNTLIHNLNISRDSFKKYLSCPLFLWLPEYAVVKITRHAPDFFSVRSGTFYFSNPPEIVTEQIFQSVSSNYLNSSSLSLANKLKQIEMLENLLAEYRGLHREKQDKQTELKLLEKISSLFQYISEYRKAIIYYEQSLAISREINSKLDEGNNLGNLGVVYEDLGEYRKAINYFEQSIEISREIGNNLSLSANLGNLGNAYFKLGNYLKAINYHEESLTLSLETHDNLGESSALGNLALDYYKIGDYGKAINLYERSLVIANKIGDHRAEAAILNGLGNTYRIIGDHKRAIDYYEQSLKIKKEIGNRYGEGISLGNIGVVYERLGDYNRAIEYQNQSLKISREIGNRTGEASSLRDLGSAYFNFGEREMGCAFLRQSLIIFEEIESPSANEVLRVIAENCIGK